MLCESTDDDNVVNYDDDEKKRIKINFNKLNHILPVLKIDTKNPALLHCLGLSQHSNLQLTLTDTDDDDNTKDGEGGGGNDCDRILHHSPQHNWL